MRDRHLRGEPSRRATQRQMDVLAAYVAAGGSVPDAAAVMGIQPSTARRHLADLRARLGLTTEQLIYRGRAEGWLVVPSLEPSRMRTVPRLRVPLAGGLGIVSADVPLREHVEQSPRAGSASWATAKWRGALPSGPSGDGLSRGAGTSGGASGPIGRRTWPRVRGRCARRGGS